MTDKLVNNLEANSRGYRPFAAIELHEPAATTTGEQQLSNGEAVPDDIDMEDIDEPETLPSPPPPSFEDPSTYEDAVIDELLVLSQGSGLRPTSKVFRLGVCRNVNLGVCVDVVAGSRIQQPGVGEKTGQRAGCGCGNRSFSFCDQQ